MEVKWNGSTHTLNLLVVKRNGPALHGTDWFRKLKLEWSAVRRVECESVDELCDRYYEVFQPTRGKVTGVKANSM